MPQKPQSLPYTRISSAGSQITSPTWHKQAAGYPNLNHSPAIVFNVPLKLLNKTHHQVEARSYIAWLPASQHETSLLMTGFYTAVLT